MRTLPCLAFLLMICGLPLAAQTPTDDTPITVQVPLNEASTLDRVSSAFAQAGLDLTEPSAYGRVIGIGFDRDSSPIEYVAQVEGRGETSYVTLSAAPRRATSDRKALRTRLESLAAVISGGA
jgi:hypothetical protein